MDTGKRDARWLQRGAALTVVTALFWLSRTETFAASERYRLADRFSFTNSTLPELEVESFREVREVCPSLEHIAPWISSVGGGVGFSDLDGDGLENDVCLVETRSDKIMISPTPDSGERYEPFVLKQSLGREARVAPMGCLAGDFNEDGRLDLLAYFWGRPPVLHLRNENEEFNADAFDAHDLVSSDERWFTNTVTRGDLDGDGHPDLIFGNYFPDDAHVLDPTWTGRASMQHSMSRAGNGGTNRIFLWSAEQPAEVPFAEASDALKGHDATAWTLAIAAGDLNGDQLPELYFANDFGSDVLLLNQSEPGELKFRRMLGTKTLTTPTSKVLGRDSFKGMGVDFGDVNGDGVLDIYVSNITDTFALEESQLLFVSLPEAQEPWGDVAPYRDDSERLGVSRTGWCWDSKLCDLNNDSVLEALQATGFVKGEVDRWAELQEVATGNDELLANPSAWPNLGPNDDLCGHQRNPLFVLHENGRYCDVSAEVGLTTDPVTRGIALADVDADGDLDLAYGNQWEPSTFHRNESDGLMKSLGLRLRLPLEPGPTVHLANGERLPMATRAAIGAQARVTLPDGRVICTQVDGGNGHSGMRGKELHCGLGRVENDTKLNVTLDWRDPSGQVHSESFELTPGRHTLALGWRGENQ